MDNRAVTTRDVVGGSAGATTSDAGAGSAGATTAGANGSAGAPLDAGANGAPRKLDLLLMVDNSISMSDKQTILSLTVPDLVSRLVNPICLDATGSEYPAPAPGGSCPAGQRRQFDPIRDLHIGMVTSSLGDIGANVACPSEGFPEYVPDRVDMAHLVGSLDRGRAAGNAQDFLEWHDGSDLDQFNSAFQRMLVAVGEKGCGWEASLESWYRFLVDPKPYRSLAHVACPGSTSTALNCVAPSTDESGQLAVDETLLAQRSQFLRPDSLVAIVMLTDENDCSLQPDAANGQSWVVVATDNGRPMFRGSSACDNDPNDKCCYSCPLPAPEGCLADPVCDGNADAGVQANRLPDAEDGKNLRCFDQKRRFGYDFLYPTQRYVNALTKRELCTDQPDLGADGCTSSLAPNPLFAGGRSPDQVFLAGILGVPWQAIASGLDAQGRPLTSPEQQLRFKSSSELTNADWTRIAGSPGTPWRAASPGLPELVGTPPVPPGEPTMVESAVPRPNISSGNPINGREYDTTQGPDAVPSHAPDDLQYACIFPLPAPRDCALRDPAIDSCDCYSTGNDRPLCESTPGSGNPGTTQYWAKAYPGLRELQVLRGLGQNSTVASICARNTTDNGRPDFGYRPAMLAIVDRLQSQLRP